MRNKEKIINKIDKNIDKKICRFIMSVGNSITVILAAEKIILLAQNDYNHRHLSKIPLKNVKKWQFFKKCQKNTPQNCVLNFAWRYKKCMKSWYISTARCCCQFSPTLLFFYVRLCPFIDMNRSKIIVQFHKYHMEIGTGSSKLIRL